MKVCIGSFIRLIKRKGEKKIYNTNARKCTEDAKDGTRNHFGRPREREHGQHWLVHYEGTRKVA